MIRKIICALDTGDLGEALATVRRLHKAVGAFKIGHALTLPHGLSVIDELQGAGAERIFLDLKFHDIPNSVALAVREAAKHDVWMLTVHLAGGSAMLQAAMEEARGARETLNVVGVSVLTSLDEHALHEQLGVERSILDHMTKLSQLAMDCGLDGVVSSPQEVRAIRAAIGKRGFIVTPGIRPLSGDKHDQRRVGTAQAALADGADYLVIGRALTESADVEATLAALGFEGIRT